MNVRNYEQRLTIGAISELVYCKRRYYLAYVEKLPQYNLLIELGAELHEDVHESSCKKTYFGYEWTNYTVFSDDYNMWGVCDKIECHASNDGVDIDQFQGRFQLIPVEYKRGKKRAPLDYIIQVVGYAMCLEEMFHCHISTGCLYFPEEKVRYEFEITNYHRQLVQEAIRFVETYDLSVIHPNYQKRCHGCSLYDFCQPRETRLEEYIQGLWGDM